MSSWLHLKSRHADRNRDNIEISFDETVKHSPEITAASLSFSGFNLYISVMQNKLAHPQESFCVSNGQYTPAQKTIMESIAAVSQFNAEQYFIEHTSPDKNIVIRAGAGTGKTFTMISRIGFVCYTQNVPLQKMAERIVMITFTNEAADQMEDKLKSYFKNCYLVIGTTTFNVNVVRVQWMVAMIIYGEVQLIEAVI